MNDKIRNYFDINKFNIYSDDNYYYFFRALEELDIASIENKTIVDEHGKLKKLITDREFYGATDKYDENSKMSLEEVVDHIKIHYNKHTNCISFTTNANVALTYGRQAYTDQYVILKVPKNEMNKDAIFAGSYMLEEVNKKIDDFVKANDLSEKQKYLLEAINNANSMDRLEEIKKLIPKDSSIDNNLFQGGLEFTTSKDYNALNPTQNLLKNKVVSKLDVLNKTLLPRVSNRLLIQTIGSAFSSLEVTHYKDISGDKLISVPKEMIDILGLLQQLPEETPHLDELKKYLISNIDNINIPITLDFPDYQLSDIDLSVDNMYDLLKGRVSYKEAYKLYHDAFYLAKSKLRAKRSAHNLKNIVGDNPKYQDIINIIDNSYGIEAEITTKLSDNLFNISESVSLNVNKDLVSYIEKLDSRKLQAIINNPNIILKDLLNTYADNKEYDQYVNKEYWFANSIIDLFNFEKYGVNEKLSRKQRDKIIEALINNNFMDTYYSLKSSGVSNEEIAYNLFYSLIRNDNNIDKNNPLTLEELEWFIGYNQIKDTKINLRSYQKVAYDNINEIYKNKQFAAAILPTGTGKSYVALAKILENPKAKVLYIAPNEIILNQMKSIIKETSDYHLKSNNNIRKSRTFANVKFDTYQILKGETGKKIKNTQYDLIILDELHRSGASKWQNDVEELLKNQSENTKVLGITATPERDTDNKDMSEWWALNLFGYTEEEIKLKKHLAVNMELADAIERGIVANPKIVNCLYSVKSSGKLDEIGSAIKEQEVNEEIKNKYERLRREVENAQGIESILHDNLKEEDKVIIFIPVTKKDNGVYEDESGEEIQEVKAHKIIKDYMTLFRQYLYSYEYLNSHPKIYGIYKRIANNELLNIEEYNYLEKEKNNILLLNKIDIYGKPTELNTEINYLADTIINYMKWEKLDIKVLAKSLNEKTNDKLETYSLLGTYSNSKNEDQLSQFNVPAKNKIKAMFVMNKLNEGAHLKGVKKIVWFRPLDSNSRILFYQQLGRCITALNPGEKIKEEEIPTVIDLVNNSLVVNYNSSIIQEEKDLNKLLQLSLWIKYNNRIPNILSNDKEELENAKSMVFINKRYSKYIDNPNLINDSKLKTRDFIREIINIGTDLDIWSINLQDEENKYVNKNKKELAEESNTFIVTPVIRDFIELDKIYNGKNITFSPEDWVKEVEVFCEKYQKWPSSRDDDRIAITKSEGNLAVWLKSSDYNKGEFKYKDIRDEDGRLLIERLDELKEKYKEKKFSPEDWVKEVEVFCENNKKWPSFYDDDKIAITKNGGNLYSWLQNYGYNKGEFKYKDIRDKDGRLLIERLDELKEKYKEKRLSPEDWVKEVEVFCENNKKWPSFNEGDKIAITKNGGNIYAWLRYTGYINGEFKYKDIRDKDGRLLIERLDELKEKYNEKNYKRLSPEDWVKEVEVFCERYKKWPSLNESDKIAITKNGGDLYSWLQNSGYYKGEFKYKDIRDKDGRLLIEKLDEIKEKYKEKNNEKNLSPEDWVKEAEVFCERYKKWPSYYNDGDKIAITKNGKNLYAWFNHSGYNNGEFKYKGIRDEEGRLLIERLDEIKEKYKEKNNERNLSPENWVKEIEVFCENNKKWPSVYDDDKIAITKNGKNLYAWLRYTGYNNGEFKYKDIRDKDGRLLIERLEEIKEKYNEIKFSPEDWVKEVEVFCKRYKKWPSARDGDKIAVTKSEKSLVNWFYHSGYNNGEFKFKDIRDKDGRLLIEKLDEIKEIYNEKNLTLSPEDWVKEVEVFCKKYQKWPSYYNDGDKIAITKSGKNLANWVNHSGYNNGEFKYKDLRDEEGRLLIERLDECRYNTKKHRRVNKVELPKDTLENNLKVITGTNNKESTSNKHK